jgi:hypothetical protein
MTLYKKLISEMYAAHEAEMKAFDLTHEAYQTDQKKLQDEYNQIGMPIKEIMHSYEKQLCGKSERSGMGVYSSKLADKFWAEIKKRYPLIDFVGVKIG